MLYFVDALRFLVGTLLGLYFIAVICRFLFQLLRVDFRNPIVAAIIAITDPPLRVFRSIIPGVYGVDLALLVLILVIGFLRYYLPSLLDGYDANGIGILVYSLGEALDIACWILLIAIFGSAILSWIAPHSYHPAARILGDVSEPVLRPFRRLLPNPGGLDLSPILALLAINLAQRLVVRAIHDFGLSLL